MSSFPIDTDGGPQVVLELIYRLKVKDVMTGDVVTSEPRATLRQVQAQMRDRGITGVPIVSSGRLLGIISIGDIIEALDGGWMEEAADRHMSTSLIVLEDDMPLSFAITYFNRYGYRRFPVLNRQAQLCGIVTAADVLRALLIEMNREVERLEARRPAPGLSMADGAPGQSMPAGGTGSVSPAGTGGKPAGAADGAGGVSGVSVLAGAPAAAGEAGKPGFRLVFTTHQFDFENAGKASAELKKALRALAVEPATIRRAAIASYELEMNQVIHSIGGTMEFIADADCIRIIASDSGPGIPDVEEALREGYSTANEWVRSLGFGAGLGLPNTRRSSDEFGITSAMGVGTVVNVTICYGERA